MRMAEQIPHLRALRAFEAAARHMSFQDAAEELGLSPSAVSHQIRTLENYLQVQLFERLTRGIALTDAGNELYPGLNAGFQEIGKAVRSTRSLNAEGILTVSAGPAITAKFLAPKLYQFEEVWPALKIELTTSTQLVNLEQKDVDIAIRFGSGNYGSLDAIRLFGEAHAPMCSPSLLAANGGGLSEPKHIGNFPLIHDDAAQLAGAAPGWPDWLAQHQLPVQDRGRHFQQTDYAIQAAIDGAGILMGRIAIASADISAGRLVMPFSDTIASPFSYYLVTQQGRQKEKPIRVFLEWLLDEAHAALSQYGLMADRLKA